MLSATLLCLVSCTAKETPSAYSIVLHCEDIQCINDITKKSLAKLSGSGYQCTRNQAVQMVSDWEVQYYDCKNEKMGIKLLFSNLSDEFSMRFDATGDDGFRRILMEDFSVHRPKEVTDEAIRFFD